MNKFTKIYAYGARVNQSVICQQATGAISGGFFRFFEWKEPSFIDGGGVLTDSAF
jgi:hypothetical protein